MWVEVIDDRMFDKGGAMSPLRSNMLRTKTTTPAIRPNNVARNQLLRQLEEGLTRKLTTLCAPAVT